MKTMPYQMLHHLQVDGAQGLRHDGLRAVDWAAVVIQTGRGRRRE